MLCINLNNLEELIFSNKSLRSKFPEMHNLFNQWELAIRVPSLRSMGKKALIDFLNQITDEQIVILETYFDTNVVLDRLDYHIVKHYDFSLENAESMLNEASIFSEFVLYRNENQLYISFWR
jgi:hypothetical protein